MSLTPRAPRRAGDLAARVAALEEQLAHARSSRPLTTRSELSERGVAVVHHGVVGTTPRPVARLVHWVGTATPAHAVPEDFWTQLNL